jgi:sugar lactone lactonase YvrE
MGSFLLLATTFTRLTTRAQIAPTIIGPTNQVKLVSSNATFAVTVFGTAPFAYQWWLNQTNLLLNATNASLILTNVQSANAGSYSVVVTNAGGSITSPPAVLLVNLPLAVFTPAGQGFTSMLGGIAVDSTDNIFFSDNSQGYIRKLTPADVESIVNFHSFYNPRGMYFDSATNIYLAGFGDCIIYRITPAGQIQPLAGSFLVTGSADGTNGAASFYNPRDVVVDKKTGALYVSDNHNNTIRKIVQDGTNWIVTTIAGQALVSGSNDGLGTNATFSGPSGMDMDASGNLYVADFASDVIRQLSPVGTNWLVRTIAGKPNIQGSSDGPGSVALFTQPSGIAVDATGNVYVGDHISAFPGNGLVRKLTQVGTNWLVGTVAGPGLANGPSDGTGAAARFYGPADMRFDTAGNLFIADRNSGLAREAVPFYGQPIITLPPQGRLSYAGTNVTLQVSVVGTAPVTCQWLLNGTNLVDGGSVSGSQTNMLNIAGVLPSYVGNYQLVVSNVFGVVTSIVADVSITLPPIKAASAQSVGTAGFIWQSFSNVAYQVQFKTNLLQTDWVNLGAPFTTNTGTASFQDSTSADCQRFYRIQLPP